VNRGLIPEKSRGSLTKRLGRTGLGRSDPLDQDLAVQIQRVRRSNHARPLGIGRRGGLSARVRRHWVAGDEQSGATGAYSGRGLAVEHHRGMRNPLAGSNIRCGAGNRLLDGEGSSAATDLAGARIRAEPKLESDCELVRARARCRCMPILGTCGPRVLCRVPAMAGLRLRGGRTPVSRRSGHWIGLLALGSSATGRGGATGAH